MSNPQDTDSTPLTLLAKQFIDISSIRLMIVSDGRAKEDEEPLCFQIAPFLEEPSLYDWTNHNAYYISSFFLMILNN